MEALRNRLAVAIWNFEEHQLARDLHLTGHPYKPVPWADAHPLDREEYVQKAGAALTAIGLDDLDAAVERASMAIHEERFSSNMRDYGRAALEAVLTP
jgi:hypothetical protein